MEPREGLICGGLAPAEALPRGLRDELVGIRIRRRGCAPRPPAPAQRSVGIRGGWSSRSPNTTPGPPRPSQRPSGASSPVAWRYGEPGVVRPAATVAYGGRRLRGNRLYGCSWRPARPQPSSVQRYESLSLGFSDAVEPCEAPSAGVSPLRRLSPAA
jgi:hypothetical protein